MRKTWLFAIAVVWAASLCGVGLWAQGGERSVSISQDGKIAVVPVIGTQAESTGSIISGEAFGFRLGGVQPGQRTVTGSVVVRLGGVWYEVSRPMTLHPAADR
jgi:hypothetical protein